MGVICLSYYISLSNTSEVRTLAFVFDVTFSMLVDLEHLKVVWELLISKIPDELDKNFGEYMFLPFHDPGEFNNIFYFYVQFILIFFLISQKIVIGVPIITKNKTELLEVIQEHYALITHMNTDCEEMSLPALFTSLHFITSYSHILLFTDDNSKHNDLLYPILNITATKRPRISFVITPGCNYGNNDKEYEKIANATGGQIYEILKRNVSSLVYGLHEHWKSNWFEIKSIDFIVGGSHEIPLYVSDLDKFLVSFTGKDVTIKILNPLRMETPGNLTINMQNVKEMIFEKPENGKWILEISSLTHHRLRVYGMEKDTSSHYFRFFAAYCIVIGLVLGFCLWNYKFFVDSFMKCWNSRPSIPSWMKFRFR